MFNNLQTRLWLLGLLGAACLMAQDAALPNCSVSVDVPNDAPVTLLGVSPAPCSATAHGSALMLDLHLSLPAQAQPGAA